MKKITLEFENEEKFNRFRFMLQAGASELIRFYDMSNQPEQTIGVRKHFADVWQQLEDQKNVAE